MFHVLFIFKSNSDKSTTEAGRSADCKHFNERGYRHCKEQHRSTTTRKLSSTQRERFGVGRSQKANASQSAVGQLVNESFGRLVGWSFGWSVCRSVQSINRSVGRSLGRSVSQSVGQLVGQSVGQSVGRSVG